MRKTTSAILGHRREQSDECASAMVGLYEMIGASGNQGEDLCRVAGSGLSHASRSA
jgi:hypothetical protein